MKASMPGRHIAAPAGLACLLAGALFCAGIEQTKLDAARLERDAKAEFAGQLSGTGPARVAASHDAAGTQTPRDPFVVAETATTAAAEIDRLIRTVVTKANGAVLSTQAAAEQGDGAAMRRIEVQAVVEGRMEAIQRTLFSLETGAPMIFIDDLVLQPAERSTSKREVIQAPLLQATLTLSAFWRSGS